MMDQLGAFQTKNRTNIVRYTNATTIDVSQYIKSQKDGVYSFEIKGKGKIEDYIYSSKSFPTISPKLVLTPYEITTPTLDNAVIDEIKILKKAEYCEKSNLIIAIYDNDSLKILYVKPLSLDDKPVGAVEVLEKLNFQMTLL